MKAQRLFLPTRINLSNDEGDEEDFDPGDGERNLRDSDGSSSEGEKERRIIIIMKRLQKYTSRKR